MNPPRFCQRKPVRVPRLRKFEAVMVALVAALLAIPLAAQNIPPQTPETFGKIYRCKPGPWGDLEYYHMHLEMPDRMVELIGNPGSTPVWHFPGYTEATLRALFESAKLSKPLQDYLLHADRRVLGDGVVTVYPPAPDLLGLTPTQRSIIYQELAKTELNSYYSAPFHIVNGDPDSWYARSKLRPELLQALKKMTYMRGEVLCFSDLPVLLGMVNSDAETHDVLKAISRTSSIVLRLNAKPGSDLDQIVRYWAADQRNTSAEPALLSSTTTEGLDHLDCNHLLPFLPRRYLHNYFLEGVSIFARMPDCHWTALNFFNLTPLDYHLDPRLVTLHITEDYTRVDPPYTFGDVLMFLPASGVPLHSCVYIADDIVYTKNGRMIATPWVLNKLSDVRRLYSFGEPTTVHGFRLKTPPRAVRD